MFEHLLVPLDGSQLAEAALPAAAYLAQTLGARVTLVHVVERDAPQAIHGERHLADADEAHAYLEEVAGRAFPKEPGVQAEQHVHSAEVSDVARSLVEHIGELGPDAKAVTTSLIVMCAHGWGGLRSRLFGSIAQQIIGLGTTPVLLIQPARGEATAAFACRRLLVPLDGQPEHEQGLVMAISLAQASTAALHLLMVVHTLSTLPGEQAAAGRLLPGATSALLDLRQQDAEEYLRRQAAPMQAAGLAVTAESRRGDPAKIIVRTAKRINADLIVLGTHGKSGMDAFWSNSVAPQVSSLSRVPLLLVPVREAKGQSL